MEAGMWRGQLQDSGSYPCKHVYAGLQASMRGWGELGRTGIPPPCWAAAAACRGQREEARPYILNVLLGNNRQRDGC